MRPIIAVALLALSCGEDEPSRAGFLKAIVDQAALSAGMSVKVCSATNLGFFDVALAREVPVVPDAKLATEAGPALMVTVKANQTGTSTSLAGVRSVDRVPQEPDEAACQVLEGRKAVRIRFFNFLSTGLKLSPGATYTGTVSIAHNDWIEDLPSLATGVTVSAGCE